MVDVLLVIVLVVAGLLGWRSGLLRGWLPLAGWLAGAIAGLLILPHLTATLGVPAGLARLAVVLLGILILAGIGSGLAAWLARRLSGVARSQPGRIADSALGAVVSVLVWASLAGLVLPATRSALPADWSRSVSDSRVLRVINNATPDPVTRWLAQLRTSLAEGGFPEVFRDGIAEPVPSVPTPIPTEIDTPGVARAAAGIVKVHALSRACGGEAGSGWVVAGQRVVTNAHVVAGSETVTVQVGGLGRAYSAAVVGFDPDVDVAILDVPGLSAPALTRAGPLSGGDAAVVAGFPLDGPYDVGAARIRTVLPAAGYDIYSRRPVQRQVYSLYATVRPGNSGGPLLTTSGEVAGTVFARSTTGYALTNAATSGLVDTAAALSTPVSTQSCLSS